MIIQELTLEHLLQCPLMTPTGPSKEETCANALASWTLRRAFEDKFLGKPQDILHDIRGKVLELWDGPPEEAGLLARTAAFRLFNLALDYEVIHLEQPYNLILSGYTIQGRYALLRKRRGEELPLVLILHDAEPSMKKEQALPPDVITLSRFVHVYKNTGYKDAQVIHFPVFRGKVWFNKFIDVNLATKYLESMLKIAALNPSFPIMGGHCSKCTTKPCLEIFKNG